MNIEKKFLFCFFCILSSVCNGQQSPLLTQFPQDKTSFNAAYASTQKTAYLSLFHRSQWLGYDDNTGAYGAPSTQYFGFQVPVSDPFGGAIGASILRDNLGPFSNYDFRLVISTLKRVGDFDLSFGMQPTYKVQSLRSDVLDPVNVNDPTLLGILSSGNLSSSTFDLNAGLAISADRYTIGLSANNLLKSDLRFMSSEGLLSREMSLYGSYNLKIAYKLEFDPYIFLKSNFASQTFDLGALFTYANDYTAGLVYRNEESISFLASAQNLKASDITVGFSFDFVIVSVIDKTPSSFEFFVIYDLPEIGIGKRKIIRTPRFRY